MGYCGRLWDTVGDSGRLRETLDVCGRLWKVVGDCGRLWDTVDGSERHIMGWRAGWLVVLSVYADSP